MEDRSEWEEERRGREKMKGKTTAVKTKEKVEARRKGRRRMDRKEI